VPPTSVGMNHGPAPSSSVRHFPSSSRGLQNRSAMLTTGLSAKLPTTTYHYDRREPVLSFAELRTRGVQSAAIPSPDALHTHSLEADVPSNKYGPANFIFCCLCGIQLRSDSQTWSTLGSHRKACHSCIRQQLDQRPPQFGKEPSSQTSYFHRVRTNTDVEKDTPSGNSLSRMLRANDWSSMFGQVSEPVSKATVRETRSNISEHVDAGNTNERGSSSRSRISLMLSTSTPATHGKHRSGDHVGIADTQAEEHPGYLARNSQMLLQSQPRIQREHLRRLRKRFRDTGVSRMPQNSDDNDSLLSLDDKEMSCADFDAFKGRLVDWRNKLVLAEQDSAAHNNNVLIGENECGSDATSTASTNTHSSGHTHLSRNSGSTATPFCDLMSHGQDKSCAAVRSSKSSQTRTHEKITFCDSPRRRSISEMLADFELLDKTDGTIDDLLSVCGRSVASHRSKSRSRSSAGVLKSVLAGSDGRTDGIMTQQQLICEVDELLVLWNDLKSRNSEVGEPNDSSFQPATKRVTASMTSAMKAEHFGQYAGPRNNYYVLPQQLTQFREVFSNPRSEIFVAFRRIPETAIVPWPLGWGRQSINNYTVQLAVLPLVESSTVEHYDARGQPPKSIIEFINEPGTSLRTVLPSVSSSHTYMEYLKNVYHDVWSGKIRREVSVLMPLQHFPSPGLGIVDGKNVSEGVVPQETPSVISSYLRQCVSSLGLSELLRGQVKYQRVAAVCHCLPEAFRGKCPYDVVVKNEDDVLLDVHLRPKFGYSVRGKYISAELPLDTIPLSPRAETGGHGSYADFLPRSPLFHDDTASKRFRAPPAVCRVPVRLDINANINGDPTYLAGFSPSFTRRHRTFSNSSDDDAISRPQSHLVLGDFDNGTNRLAQPNTQVDNAYPVPPIFRSFPASPTPSPAYNKIMIRRRRSSADRHFGVTTTNTASHVFPDVALSSKPSDSSGRDMQVSYQRVDETLEPSSAKTAGTQTGSNPEQFEEKVLESADESHLKNDGDRSSFTNSKSFAGKRLSSPGRRSNGLSPSEQKTLAKPNTVFVTLSASDYLTSENVDSEVNINMVYPPRLVDLKRFAFPLCAWNDKDWRVLARPRFYCIQHAETFNLCGPHCVGADMVNGDSSLNGIVRGTEVLVSGCLHPRKNLLMHLSDPTQEWFEAPGLSPNTWTPGLVCLSDEILNELILVPDTTEKPTSTPGSRRVKLGMYSIPRERPLLVYPKRYDSRRNTLDGLNKEYTGNGAYGVIPGASADDECKLPAENVRTRPSHEPGIHKIVRAATANNKIFLTELKTRSCIAVLDASSKAPNSQLLMTVSVHDVGAVDDNVDAEITESLLLDSRPSERLNTTVPSPPPPPPPTMSPPLFVKENLDVAGIIVASEVYSQKQIQTPLKSLIHASTARAASSGKKAILVTRKHQHVQKRKGDTAGLTSPTSPPARVLAAGSGLIQLTPETRVSMSPILVSSSLELKPSATGVNYEVDSLPIPNSAGKEYIARSRYVDGSSLQEAKVILELLQQQKRFNADSLDIHTEMEMLAASLDGIRARVSSFSQTSSASNLVCVPACIVEDDNENMSTTLDAWHDTNVKTRSISPLKPTRIPRMTSIHGTVVSQEVRDSLDGTNSLSGINKNVYSPVREHREAGNTAYINGTLGHDLSPIVSAIASVSERTLKAPFPELNLSQLENLKYKKVEHPSSSFVCADDDTCVSTPGGAGADNITAAEEYYPSVPTRNVSTAQIGSHNSLLKDPSRATAGTLEGPTVSNGNLGRSVQQYEQADNDLGACMVTSTVKIVPAQSAFDEPPTVPLFSTPLSLPSTPQSTDETETKSSPYLALKDRSHKKLPPDLLEMTANSNSNGHFLPTKQLHIEIDEETEIVDSVSAPLSSPKKGMKPLASCRGQQAYNSQFPIPNLGLEENTDLIGTKPSVLELYYEPFLRHFLSSHRQVGLLISARIY
jgi:hypothetical protein